MNKKRERLVELLKETRCERSCDGFKNIEVCNGCTAYERYAQSADYLLANGVIVPPVKIQTKVYKIFQGKIYEYEVASYTVDADGFSFIHLAYMEGNTVYGATHSIEEFNKQYSLTKEEAEAKLKEGVQG